MRIHTRRRELSRSLNPVLAPLRRFYPFGGVPTLELSGGAVKMALNPFEPRRAKTPREFLLSRQKPADLRTGGAGNKAMALVKVDRSPLGLKPCSTKHSIAHPYDKVKSAMLSPRTTSDRLFWHPWEESQSENEGNGELPPRNQPILPNKLDLSSFRSLILGDTSLGPYLILSHPPQPRKWMTVSGLIGDAKKPRPIGRGFL